MLKPRNILASNSIPLVSFSLSWIMHSFLKVFKGLLENLKIQILLRQMSLLFLGQSLYIII